MICHYDREPDLSYPQFNFTSFLTRFLNSTPYLRYSRAFSLLTEYLVSDRFSPRFHELLRPSRSLNLHPCADFEAGGVSRRFFHDAGYDQTPIKAGLQPSRRSTVSHPGGLSVCRDACIYQKNQFVSYNRKFSKWISHAHEDGRRTGGFVPAMQL